MISRTYSAVTFGLKSIKIEIEVESVFGTPKLVIIGLPTKAVEEAKERITAALVACGLRIKAKRTIVNLAPADIKKTGSGLELAIAVAIVKHYGLIKINTDDSIFFGELSLDGKLKRIRGALPLVLNAKERGYKQVYVPRENQHEVSMVQGIDIYPVASLQDFLAMANGQKKMKPVKAKKSGVEKTVSIFNNSNKFPPILDQQQGLRALTIAAVGRHNMLLIGPPGAGKSLLAQSLQRLLPPLSSAEALEVTALYSIRGLAQNGVIRHRPFRSPHHTISKIGLLGGGQSLLPGEISLAHRGVLFLDEFLEFPRTQIEALRQPLESGKISIIRSAGSAIYPAAFSLVAATNPCPCGYYQSQQKSCQCSAYQRQQYLAKLSGPIIDRIDLYLWISPVKISRLSAKLDKNESINNWRKRVREIHEGNVFREERGQELVPYSKYLSRQAQIVMNRAADEFSFSARGYYKTLAVARTIADLAKSTEISAQHLGEALQFRQTTH